MARERRPCSGCWPGWKLRIPEKSRQGMASAWDITPRSMKRLKLNELSWRTCVAWHPTLPNHSSARFSGHSCSPAMTWKNPLGAFRRREDKAGAGPSCRIRRQRATARRADQQPRSCQREQVLGALRGFRGAIVLVTHDEGAVEALSPERVIVLPDGVEDAWNEDFVDLVALA